LKIFNCLFQDSIIIRATIYSIYEVALSLCIIAITAEFRLNSNEHMINAITKMQESIFECENNIKNIRMLSINQEDEEIVDYQKYSEYIEIEVIPNAGYNDKNYFIRIEDEYKYNFHIYFNNNEEIFYISFVGCKYRYSFCTKVGRCPTYIISINGLVNIVR